MKMSAPTSFAASCVLLDLVALLTVVFLIYEDVSTNKFRCFVCSARSSSAALLTVVCLIYEDSTNKFRCFVCSARSSSAARLTVVSIQWLSVGESQPTHQTKRQGRCIFTSSVKGPFTRTFNISNFSFI